MKNETGTAGDAVLEQGDGKSLVRYELNDFTLNAGGLLHGGVLYALMDVGAFVAVQFQREFFRLLQTRETAMRTFVPQRHTDEPDDCINAEAAMRRVRSMLKPIGSQR